MATPRRRFRRALEVTGVARRSRLLRVLREVGVTGAREATEESAGNLVDVPIDKGS